MILFTSTLIYFNYLFSYSYSTPIVNPTVRNIGQSIDYNVNPCEDFYAFACGNWITHHPRPKYESQWNTFIEVGYNMQKINRDILQESIASDDTTSLKASKKLYADCMKEETQSVQGLKEIIAKIGGWPLLNSNWSSTGFDLWKFIGKVQNLFGVSVLLRVDVKYDFTVPSNLSNTIYLDQADLYVTSELLTQTHLKPEIISGYQKLIKTIAQELGDLSSVTHLDKKIEDIVSFELKLAEILTKEEDRYEGAFVSTISHAQLIYAYAIHGININLIGFMDEVFATSRVTLSSSEKLIVIERWYLQKLLILLKDTPKETVVNYVVWRVIGVFARYGNKAITKAAHDFRNLFVGADEQEPRWDTCTSLAYGAGAAQKYLERQFEANVKERVEDVTYLIEDMTKFFVSTSKLDRSTKLSALEKVTNIIECIGYPNWLKDSHFLNEKYLLKNMDTDKLPFFEKLVLLLHQAKDFSLTDLRKPFDKSCEWSLSKRGLTFLPYFDGSRDTLNFPMAFLQSPLFSATAPTSVNFGALGTTVGHEIAHSLPKIGWTKNIFGNVSSIGQCFVDEYQSFTTSNLSLIDTHNPNIGDATLSENFPDNVGLQMAFYTYKNRANSSSGESKTFFDDGREYTDEQLFFLAFAQNFCEASTSEILKLQTLSDSHSIGKYRVLGTLRNFPEFSKAWQCKSGTYMNPISKCKIFDSS